MALYLQCAYSDITFICTHYNPNDHFVLFYLSYLYLQHLKFVILSKINARESLQLLYVLYFIFRIESELPFLGT